MTGSTPQQDSHPMASATLGQADFERFTLPCKAVQVTPLDGLEKPIPMNARGFRTATGFIREESGKPFLYACWHTVTGIDPYAARLPAVPQLSRKLRIRLQNVMRTHDHWEFISGEREVIVELYDAVTGNPHWLQDRQYVPNEDLEAVGLRMPFRYDAVKVAMPDAPLGISQVIKEPVVFDRQLLCGYKTLVVGYPYGYSALENPTPIVLTTHIAATLTKARRHEFLIDRAGMPGMSGSPVFLEHESQLRLIGMYTGCISPEGVANQSSSLGSCVNLLPSWCGECMEFISACDASAVDLNSLD